MPPPSEIQDRTLFVSCGAIFLVILGLAAAWHWTPLNEWVDFERIAAWERSFEESPAALYAVVAAYIIGSAVFFPVMLLTAVTIFTFGPILGNAYALAGWLSSAALGYSVGRALGRDLLRRLTGPRLDRLALENRRNGLIAVLAARILPIAPFTLVNLFIGASRIRFCDFILGSLIGRIPGLLALTLFGFQVESFVRAPMLRNFALLIVMLLGSILLYRRLSSRLAESLAVLEPAVGTDAPIKDR